MTFWPQVPKPNVTTHGRLAAKGGRQVAASLPNPDPPRFWAFPRSGCSTGVIIRGTNGFSNRSAIKTSGAWARLSGHERLWVRDPLDGYGTHGSQPRGGGYKGP